jgi:hypothetical protein
MIRRQAEHRSAAISTAHLLGGVPGFCAVGRLCPTVGRSMREGCQASLPDSTQWQV